MVEGIVYLLVSEPNRADYVSRYIDSEMLEVFTAEERKVLATKGVLNRFERGKLSCVFTDMAFAAQKLAGRRS